MRSLAAIYGRCESISLAGHLMMVVIMMLELYCSALRPIVSAERVVPEF